MAEIDTRDVEQLREALDVLWSELPAPEVLSLRKERSEVFELCVALHEELYHS